MCIEPSLQRQSGGVGSVPYELAGWAPLAPNPLAFPCAANVATPSSAVVRYSESGAPRSKRSPGHVKHRVVTPIELGDRFLHRAIFYPTFDGECTLGNGIRHCEKWMDPVERCCKERRAYHDKHRPSSPRQPPRLTPCEQSPTGPASASGQGSPLRCTDASVAREEWPRLARSP